MIDFADTTTTTTMLGLTSSSPSSSTGCKCKRFGPRPRCYSSYSCSTSYHHHQLNKGLSLSSTTRMMISTVVLLVLLSVQGAMVGAADVQTIVEEPSDTRALVGSTAVLRCRVHNQQGRVTWTKDGHVLGTDRSLPAYPRYSMIGSSMHGEYHLEIRDVRLSDDSEYRCQLTATANQTFRRSPPVRLTVLVKPDQPRLTPSSGPISAREGRNVSVTCQTNGAKPPAFLTWALVRHANGSGMVRKLYAPNESIIRDHPAEKVHDTTSVLEYALQRNDDASYVACMVEHETLSSPLVATVQLRLQYSPKVNVSLISPEPILEGGRLELSCHVDAYPADNIRYVWYRDNQLLRGHNKSRLVLTRLNVSQHNNALFRCHADNDVDEGGYGNYTLKMKYKPIISSPLPPEVYVNENQSVTLSCEADANPPAKIVWTKDTSTQQLSTENNFTLHRFQYANQGTYKCTAGSNEFDPVSREFKVYIKGPPRVEIRSLVYGRKGAENFQLPCHVRSPPGSDTTVMWKRGDDDYTISDDGHYSVPPYSDTTASHRSVLTIRQLEPSDFGIYNCSAHNRLGSDFGLTHLVQAEEFPTYAILGVAGGCLAILALALALIIVNRKYLCRSKASNNGDERSDITVKQEVLHTYGGPSIDYPDMFKSCVADDRLMKGYIGVPQDDIMDPSAPPAYMTTFYTTSPAVTHTTFVNGVIPFATTANGGGGGPDRYGDVSPPLLNGRLGSNMTYLDDSMLVVSPTTTTTTVAPGTIGEQQTFLINGYHHHHSPSMSPLSPSAGVNNRGGADYPMAVGGLPASSIGSPYYHQHNNVDNNQYFHRQPPIVQAQVYSNGNGNTGGRPMMNGGSSLARVDLLNGHVAPGGAAGGTTMTPNGQMIMVPVSAIHHHYDFDPPAVYRPSTGYGDQPPYYPAGVRTSPLEPVQELPTPDTIDDLPPPTSASASAAAPPPPPPRSHSSSPHDDELNNYTRQQQPLLRSSISSDGRCPSQLSTHV